MIRINLLPTKRYKKRSVTFEFYLLIATLLLSLSVAGGIFYKNTRDIEGMQGQINTIKQQTAALQTVYKEFLSLELEKKELTRRIAAVDKIKEGRAIAPRILYDLPLITKDNLWFKKLSKNEGNFELEGRSVDNESVSDFTERLAKLPYMKNVELRSVEDITEANITLKKFILQGRLAQ
jgi:Tfp pilus assembly protein PilN